MGMPVPGVDWGSGGGGLGDGGDEIEGVLDDSSGTLAVGLEAPQGGFSTLAGIGGALRWTRVLVAGVGAMALFRTSLFMVRAGNQEIGVGPGSILQILRDAADREVDRMRAQSRGQDIAKLMQGLDYNKASEGLVPYCLALMQNVPSDAQEKLEHAVELLTADLTLKDAIKVRILGLHLLNVVGPAVPIAAVDGLRDELKTPNL
jgi:hypothetical protein